MIQDLKEMKKSANYNGYDILPYSYVKNDELVLEYAVCGYGGWTLHFSQTIEDAKKWIDEQFYKPI